MIGCGVVVWCSLLLMVVLILIIGIGVNVICLVFILFSLCNVLNRFMVVFDKLLLIDRFILVLVVGLKLMKILFDVGICILI